MGFSPFLIRKGRNCDFFSSWSCCLTQPTPGGSACAAETVRTISISTQEAFFGFRFYFFSLMSNSLALTEKKKTQKVFFKQRKHTCKLPCQLASQGCQTHLAPKEIQKANSRNQNQKFIFITAKVFFHCLSFLGLFGCRSFILALILSGVLGHWDLVGWAKKKRFVPF